MFRIVIERTFFTGAKAESIHRIRCTENPPRTADTSAACDYWEVERIDHSQSVTGCFLTHRVLRENGFGFVTSKCLILHS